MNDFQFNNLIKAVESCFKQNYCTMYFEDLYKKFSPEITGTVLCKVFAFRENGLTDAGETEEDMKAYPKAHPHTCIVKLFYKNCGRTRNDFVAVETGNTEP